MTKKKEPAEIIDIKNICEVMSSKKKGSICEKVKKDKIISSRQDNDKKDKK